MKKRIIYILFLGLLISCSENVQSNDEPTIQGLKDNVEWEAYANSGEVAGTTVTLIGVGSGTIKLKMKLPVNNISQTDELSWVGYTLGTGNTNQAFFNTVINKKEYTYKTASGTGDGEIVITNYDGVTISGNYHFNAINSVSATDVPESVNFNKGIFYKIPLTFK